MPFGWRLFTKQAVKYKMHGIVAPARTAGNTTLRRHALLVQLEMELSLM